MKLEDNILARIYSFDLQFGGGKRTKFYRKLYGFKSKSTREDQEGREHIYENFYPGILTSIPHLRLGKSVIAIPKSAEDTLNEFFGRSHWSGIDLYAFDGILPSEDRMEAMREALNRIGVAEDQNLSSEIDYLNRMRGKNQLDNVGSHRIKRTLKKSEKLMSLDWTDGQEFSKNLNEKIRNLRD